MEQEMSQEYKKGDIEIVSINSVYMNKNQSMLIAKLDMHAGNNKVIIPYKRDTGSDSNIMPWYIFKKLFPRDTEAELTKIIKNHIKLKTYNKTVIAQLGTCMVIINYQDNKKKCEFFLVPRDGQVLLGMPDTTALNIINVRKNIELTQKIYNVFDNVFNGIECFEGTFLLQLKPDSKPYQAPSRHVAYALQKPFKDELDWLQKLDIIAPLGIDRTAECCNSFVLVPKANGRGRLCLDPVRLNQALIRPVHRGPMLNDILPRLSNVKYMSIIDAS